jgi:cytochrome P450
VHHNEDMYGADADMFRPERWLEASGTKLEAMKRLAELIFATGKYRCLGKTIAFLELNKVFAEVSVSRFFKNYEKMLTSVGKMFL